MSKILSITNIVDTGDVVSFDVEQKRFLSFLGSKVTRVSISNLVVCPEYARHHLSEQMFHHEKEINMFACENGIEEITSKKWFYRVRK